MHILEFPTDKPMSKENIYDVIARHIRLERTRAGLTLELLAEKADISPSFLAYIETGKKKASVSTVAKIAKALDVNTSALFNEKASSADDKNQTAVLKLLKLLHGLGEKDKTIILSTVTGLSRALRDKK